MGLVGANLNQGMGGKLLKIKQTLVVSLTDPVQRRRLESTTFPSMEQAKQQVQSLFPNHLVKAEPGRISVVLRDKSFQVAVFQEVHDSLRRLIWP